MQQRIDSRLTAAAAAATKERREAIRRQLLATRPPAAQNGRSAAATAIAPLLRQGLIDVDAFEKLRLADSERLRRDAQEQGLAFSRDRAAEGRRFADEARRRADGLANARANIAPDDEPYPYYVWLPTPNAVSATANMDVRSESIVPYDSTVKVSLDSSAAFGYDDVSFEYIWENPSDRYAVINADGFMAFHGFGNAIANGGIFPGDRESSITVNASLSISALWTDPPTPIYSTNGWSLAQVLTVSADAGGFLSTGDSEVQAAYRGYDFGYTIIPVPPSGALAFELVLSAWYGSSDGFVFLDAYDGNNTVSAFGTAIAILS